MLKFKTLFCAIILCFINDYSFANASCEKGCSCDASCTCGCQEGYPCTCHQGQNNNPISSDITPETYRSGCEAGRCGYQETQPEQNYSNGILDEGYQNEYFYPENYSDAYDTNAYMINENDAFENNYGYYSEPYYDSNEYAPQESYGYYPDRDAIDDLFQEQICSLEPGTYNNESYEICNAWGNYPLLGIWLPEGPPLFRPFVADPRQICYSIGWRFDDQSLNKNIVDVSFGDILGIIEWCNVGPWYGRMRVEVEGALWAVFAPLEKSAPLINADYYVGIPITYAVDDWSFRLRIYHVSSHIGDEFLLENKHFHRRNPSAESVDFFVSNQFTDDIRLYGGVGYVLHQDESFQMGRYYAEAGLELRLYELSCYDYPNRILGVPFYGMHFRFRSDFNKHLDATYVLGYEWQKLRCNYRRLRIFMEYHDGYSLEGQFSKCPVNYFALRMSYGY